jgi:hypothetical protein
MGPWNMLAYNNWQLKQYNNLGVHGEYTYAEPLQFCAAECCFLQQKENPKSKH